MKRLISIFFQIDEAANYITDGRQEHLRLALLLLDNAAEIQMYLRIQQELREEKSKKRFKESILEGPKEIISDSLKMYIDWEPIGLSKKRKINRYYDEKIKYLFNDLELIDKNIGEVLSYLHKYRNEAYHRVKVRQETLETAAKILLEINLEMLNLIPTSGNTYVSNGDYSWINERLGYNAASAFLGEGVRNDFIDEIKKSVSLLDSDVANYLDSHLQSRINDLEEDLDFIIEMLPHCKNRDDAIRFSNYIKSSEAGDFDLEDLDFENFESGISIKDIDDIKASLNNLKNESNKIEAFKLFSMLEPKLEKIESLVIGIVADLDYMIQMEIDKRRGK